jgi:hypothetical protein
MSWAFNSLNLTATGDYISYVIAGYDLPPVRDSNVLIPLKDGRTWVRKCYDQRKITFGMTFMGSSLSDLQTNIDAMLAKLSVRTQAYLVQTMPDSSTRQAYAEVISEIKLKHNGPYLAQATVDFLLAEPFFRGTVLYEVEATIDTSPHDFDVVNAGSAEDRSSIITFTGPLSHPTITNTTTGATLEYNAALAAGSNIITVNCANLTAVDETAASVLNKIIHTGDPAFMVWAAGTNHCHVTDGTATTGKVKAAFYPPYL